MILTDPSQSTSSAKLIPEMEKKFILPNNIDTNVNQIALVTNTHPPVIIDNHVSNSASSTTGHISNSCFLQQCNCHCFQ